jgi:hypothetical protein
MPLSLVTTGAGRRPRLLAFVLTAFVLPEE